MNNWQQIDLSGIDTPALLVDKESVMYNIELALNYVEDSKLLRPHVKTHKSLAVAKLQIGSGINKFKCATIAEAEMMGMAGAEDVLLAYQPQGPKLERIYSLVNAYPKTKFSVLVDNVATCEALNNYFGNHDMILSTYIDVNIGQNRTGIRPKQVMNMLEVIQHCGHINILGLHCYDGHIHMSSLEERQLACTTAFREIESLKAIIEEKLDKPIVVIAGGSPTFSIHANNKKYECSPGTFIYWDEGYSLKFGEQTFKKALVICCRVISQIDENTYCIDLGHKAIASEFPMPRVKFIGFENAKHISHSEEHLVISIPKKDGLKPGDILFGFPYHVCPTVALYPHTYVIENNEITSQWEVTARNRSINI